MRGITVVNRSQCAHGGVALGSHASSHALARLGVLPAGALTLETAFAKLQVLPAAAPAAAGGGRARLGAAGRRIGWESRVVLG